MGQLYRYLDKPERNVSEAGKAAKRSFVTGREIDPSGTHLQGYLSVPCRRWSTHVWARGQTR
jgi:hypothetical protein